MKIDIRQFHERIIFSFDVYVNSRTCVVKNKNGVSNNVKNHKEQYIEIITSDIGRGLMYRVKKK